MRFIESLKEKIQEHAITVAVGGLIALLAAIFGWLQEHFILEVPVGAVIAFDLADGCPKNGKWDPFSDGVNRTIVGADWSSDAPGRELSPRRFRVSGGSQTTRLSLSQLPEIPIQFYYTTTNDVGDKPYAVMRGISATSGSTLVNLRAGGQSTAVPIEMPYIPLRLCKKVR